MEFKWVFPDKSFINTHLTIRNTYCPPPEIDCDDNCDFNKFSK